MILAIKARLLGIRTTKLSETHTRITVPRWMGREGLQRAVQGVVDDAWRQGKTVTTERPDDRTALVSFDDKRVDIRVRA